MNHIRSIEKVEHIRTGDDGLTRVEAKFVTYNILDSFRTRFVPKCTERAMAKRVEDGNLPNVRWQHQVGEPIGRIESVNERADGLYGTFILDAVPEVPRAMQALYQLRSGTLKDVSIGFSGEAIRAEDGEMEFRDIELNELSIVSQGAVPGAKVLALRSNAVIQSERAAQIVTQLQAGQIDLLDALQQLREGSVDQPVVPVESADVENAELNAEAHDAVEEDVLVDADDEPLSEEEFPSDDEIAQVGELTDDNLTDEPLPEDAERAAGPSPDASDVPGSNAAALKRYWTKGKGLPKWVNNPHPYTKLVSLLRKYITNEPILKATAAKWFREVHGGKSPIEVANAKKGRSIEEPSWSDFDAIWTQTKDRL